MSQKLNTSELEIPCEALASCNAVMLQAVVQVLSDKGLLTWKDVLDCVQKFTQKSASKSPSRNPADTN